MKLLILNIFLISQFHIIYSDIVTDSLKPDNDPSSMEYSNPKSQNNQIRPNDSKMITETNSLITNLGVYISNIFLISLFDKTFII